MFGFKKGQGNGGDSKGGRTPEQRSAAMRRAAAARTATQRSEASRRAAATRLARQLADKKRKKGN